MNIPATLGKLHAETYAAWSWRYLRERGFPPSFWTGVPSDVPFTNPADRARNEAARLKIMQEIGR